ncbi:MAG TPA: hypothetical protein VN653_18590 [Anaerolineales bacterium]|nr:hypothetical protein [Anaerolineales bacterium]
MNLLDKYIAEVGKHLPRKQRADIEAEIRSTLEDMLEERKQAEGAVLSESKVPENEALVIELLKEYGNPRKVAASYHPTPYLIGPRLFPIFVVVVQVVLSVLLGVIILTYGFSVVGGGLSRAEMLGALTGIPLRFLAGALSAFGNIVVVFAIMERLIPAGKLKELEDKWDPAQLAKAPDPDQIKFSEEIIEIFFTIAFLFIFNVYADKVGIYFFSGNQFTFVPILTAAFFTYLPWINILGLLQIGLNLVILRQGTWQIYTRVANLTLKLGTMLLALFMLTGPAILAITPGAAAGTPLGALSPDKVETLTGFVLIPFFIALFAANGVEVIQITYRLLNSHKPVRFEMQK